MEAQKYAPKIMLLSTAFTLFMIFIYWTVHAGPGAWEPNEESSASFLSFTKHFQLPVSRQKNNLPGFSF
jgi:hypothetical protein